MRKQMRDKTPGMTGSDRMPGDANAFVKKQQDALLRMSGGKARLNPEMKRTGAYMGNSGRSAVSFGDKLTRSMGDAYPVRGRGKK